MVEHKRKVGDRGQVTIPKDLRDRRGIEGGDEVVFIETDHEILIQPPSNDDYLAAGYRAHADRAHSLASEFEDASSEATDQLGDAPDWTE